MVIVTQPPKNFISSNKTWKFVSVFKTVPLWTLSWARCINLNNLVPRFGSYIFFIPLWWDETVEQWPKMGSLSTHQISTDRMLIDRTSKHMEKYLCQCNFVCDKSHKDFSVLNLLYGVGSQGQMDWAIMVYHNLVVTIHSLELYSLDKCFLTLFHGGTSNITFHVHRYPYLLKGKQSKEAVGSSRKLL